MDPQGLAVGHAQVTLLAADGGVSASARTDRDGRYGFQHVAPGRYLLSVDAPGFASSVIALAVSQGAAVDRDVSLRVVGVSEQVVVTSAGAPEMADSVAKTMSVVTAAEIHRRAEYAVADALRGVPGVRIQQRGGPGAFTSLQFRGLRSEDTAVLVDGFRFRDAASAQGDATPFLEDLVIVDLDRLEILRGSGSSLYGSHAIGGVINLVPPETGGRARGTAQAEGGSLGFRRGRATVAGGAWGDRLRYSGGFSAFEATRGVDGRDDARTVSVQSRARADLSRKLSLTAQAYFGDGHVALNDSPFAAAGAPPTPSLIRAVPLAFEQQRRLEAGLPFDRGLATFVPALDDPDAARNSRFAVSALAVTQRVATRATWRASYAHVGTTREFLDGPLGVWFEPWSTTTTESRGSTDTAQAKLTVQAGRHVVNAGYEFERERYRSRSFDADQDSSTAITQSSHSLFAQDQIALLGDRLRLAVSGRVQWFGLDRPTFSGLLFSPYDTARATPPPTAGTGDVSAAYFVARSKTKVRAHAGTGYRAPSPYERYGASFFGGTYTLFGDPRLGPDRSIAIDGGVDQWLGSDRVRVSATSFWTHLSRVIVFDVTGGIHPVTDPFGRSSGYRNTGGATVAGLELSATARPLASMEISADYTYTDGRARDVNTTGTRRLFGLSTHLLSVQYAQQIGRRVTTALDVFACSDYAASLSGRAYLFNGPVRADLTFRYARRRAGTGSVEFYARIENLVDSEIFEDGFRAPGRTAVAGVAVRN